MKKKNILVNYEKIQKLSFVIDEQFNGSENSIGLNAHLKSIHHILSKNIEIFGETLDVFSELDDKLMNLRLLVDSKLDIEIDSTNLEDVLDRLDMYQRLKKKFGGSTDLIQKCYVDFKLEKEQLESLDLNCDVLEKNISKIETELREKAEKIHSLRIKHSKSLSEVLTQKVRSLKMNGATIKIQIQKLAELGDFGISQVQFLAETNPGEGFFKIKEIASGGELSRILLSIRQILSAHDSISIFLFDEIDTGIGGETGNYIGKALHEVSRNGQVIAITHLPQIAQYADTLVIVHKDIQADNEVSRTESKVRQVVGRMIQKEVKSMTQLIQ